MNLYNWNCYKLSTIHSLTAGTPIINCYIINNMACLHDQSLSSAPRCAYETKPSSKSVLQQSVIDIEATALEMEAFRCPRKINREEGICLTWKDVWVAASNRKSGSISILKGLTSYAKSGQLLAIMGPSGYGKSTLRT